MKLTVTPLRGGDNNVTAEVVLSRRNLVSLLAKVDGRPPHSARTLEKFEEGGDVLVVKAETDDEHYSDRGYPPGPMHHDTETAIKPDPPCSGSGYAHKPHGDCPGYTYDRT